MKTIYRSLAVVVFISLFLSGCKGKTALSENEISFFAMDTSISVRVYGVNDDLLDQARNLVDKIESEFSVTQPGSDVSRLNQQGKAVVSSDVAELLTKAAALGEETHGAFDITVYPLVKAWGFTTGAYRVPSEEEIGKLLPLVDYEAVDISGNFVSLSSGSMLDFGGIAKGYTAAKLVELLKGSGVTSAVLDLGGHIQTIGARPDGSAWRVAVRSPDGSGTLGILEVKDQAVVTSGGYERFFEDEDGNVWCHIIDPATGYPVKNDLLSVTVVGDDGVLCDAFSTALYVMGEDRAAAFWRDHRGFELIMVTQEGEIMITPGVKDHFTPNDTQKPKVRVIG